MTDLKEYIESGILELYVLGLANVEEIKEVGKMAAVHPEVQEEIERITESLKKYSKEKGAQANATIKPMVLAVIDYQERMMAGEHPTIPPILNEKSKPSDYSSWLNRRDMVLPVDSNEIFAKLIGATPEATTAIVWIKTETPYEIHTHEHERFLIIEGTCDMVIDNKTYKLVPGNYMSIPLNAGHFVKVTSDHPCKVILQRVAA
jgi:mannose-6-phosphate isomerase-like protein (cupin superfamily)